MKLRKTQSVDKLIEKSKKQNKRAQLELYKLFAKDLFQVSYRILYDKELAEEVMQDGFLKAFEKLDFYQKEKGNFYSWIKRIVINKSIDAYHKKVKLKEISLPNEMNAVTESSAVNKELVNKNKEEFIKVFYTLKDNYRQIISLHYIEGFDLQEIAEILSISYTNAKTRLSRALASTRKKIEDEKNRQ